MKFLVVGCGSIGRRHIKNLQQIGEDQIIAVDLNPEYRNWVEENLKIKTHEDLEKAIQDEKPEVALICTPPSTHIKLMQICINNNLHIFVEKPVSNSLENIDSIIKEANSKNLKIAVGYNHRFNKVLEKVKQILENEEILYCKIFLGQYLPDWRPWQDYTKSYTALKSQGGGIILDGSHELDYARWFFGEPKKIFAISGKLSSLEVETEDTSEIIMNFGKTLVNIHMDFVKRDATRIGEAVSLNKTVSWDLLNSTITIFHGDKKNTETIQVIQDINETYLNEIRDFIQCIQQNKEPRVTLEDAKKTLELALKIKEISGV